VLFSKRKTAFGFLRTPPSPAAKWSPAKWRSWILGVIGASYFVIQAPRGGLTFPRGVLFMLSAISLVALMWMAVKQWRRM